MNDLPFTEDEFFRALAMLGDEQEARDAAHDLAETLAGGAYDGGWSVSDEVFAAMALLSDDLRQRVEAYKRSDWEGIRRAEVYAARGSPPGSDPTPSALRAADEERARHVADWEQGCAALADWVWRRQAGEPVGDEPPPGQVEGAE
ncbi:MAG TPA: hypothetical protein VE871_13600 [Longimicrobium sp.]|nr:hypothetical protein [Longimicrobium sp.]